VRLTALAVVALAVACAVAASGAAPALAAAAALAPSIAPAAVKPPKLDWQSCTDPAQQGFQCASARVPLNYRHPHRRKIHLALIRHPATDPAHRIGTLFFNPGGPGAPGTGVLPLGLDRLFPAALRERFDIVSWDPRGVGDSTAVHCFGSQQAENHFLGSMVAGASFPVGAAQERRWIRRYRRFARRCEREDGRLLRHVSTADTARDLDLLRRAVGDRRLTYYAVSYGTFLGATYANLFPRRVRALALDGNMDPKAYVHRRLKANGDRFLSTDLRQRTDRGASRTLAAFAELCARAGTARCAFAAQSAAATKAKFAALMRRMQNHPERFDVSSAELVSQTANALYGPAGWPALAQALQELWASGATGRPLAPAGSSSAASITQVLEQVYAIRCSESPNPGPAAFRALDSLAYARSGDLGRYWSWLSEPCSSWRATAADRYAGPWDRRTHNPILVIGNTHDPSTPYRGAKAMARQLARARLLTLDGYGHTSRVDPSACANQALTDYLVHLELPSPGTICQPDRAPFDPKFGQPLP
jgi:pimeloyl-ACP methyl ester carboxylesterase